MHIAAIGVGLGKTTFHVVRAADHTLWETIRAYSWLTGNPEVIPCPKSVSGKLAISDDTRI
jgi:hypothetical protein